MHTEAGIFSRQTEMFGARMQQARIWAARRLSEAYERRTPRGASMNSGTDLFLNYPNTTRRVFPFGKVCLPVSGLIIGRAISHMLCSNFEFIQVHLTFLSTDRNCYSLLGAGKCIYYFTSFIDVSTIQMPLL
jgi:hypothetical protein